MNATLSLILISVLLVLCILFLWLYVSALLQKQKLTSALEMKEEAINELADKHAGELKAKDETLKEREASHLRELEIRDNALRDQKELFEQQRKAQEDRFKALSEEITRRRSQELSETNAKSMDALLTPLKETISKMEKALKDTGEADAKRAGALHEIMKSMMEKSESVGAKADALADALRAKPKIQGNWGEEQLQRLLDLEGFKKGIDYDTQVSLEGEDGNRLIPDFILHFSGDKDIVVDSKVSLTAFTNYIEAKDDDTRAIESQNNLRSIKSHIDELKRKKYQNYLTGIGALEYVVMFVPNEMALHLAYQEQPDLWLSAMADHVFLASPQNLMVMLRMIRIAWTQETQMKNYRELANHAANLIDRAEKFISEMSAIKTKIDQIQKAYNAAENRLYGPRGIIVSARKINELGGKINKEFETKADEHTTLPEVEEIGTNGESSTSN